MIVACIDLQGGRAVQLIGGRRRALAVDDVLGLLDRFRRHRMLQVIDLDAALSRGSNWRLVRELCRRSRVPVRVGGGIRSVARAERVISWGAEKVIVGSAAFRNEAIHHAFLGRLTDRIGAARLILALDAEEGEIVIRGWRRRLEVRPEQVMPGLEPYCSEFLCTCVHREGRMRGTDLAWFRKLRQVTSYPVTAAGGIRSRLEVRKLGTMGMRAAVGMALYTGKLG